MNIWLRMSSFPQTVQALVSSSTKDGQPGNFRDSTHGIYQFQGIWFTCASTRAGWGRNGVGAGGGATAQNGPWKGFDLTFTATQLRQALKVSPLGTGGGPFPGFGPPPCAPGQPSAIRWSMIRTCRQRMPVCLVLNLSLTGSHLTNLRLAFLSFAASQSFENL